MSSSWHAIMSCEATALCVDRRSSTGDIAANSTTRSWGRNWQRLSICIENECATSRTCFFVDDFPLSVHKVLLPSLLMMQRMTGFVLYFLPSRHSSISIMASRAPCLTNSDMSFARPRCYSTSVRMPSSLVATIETYLWTPAKSKTYCANERALACAIWPNHHVQARAWRELPRRICHEVF